MSIGKTALTADELRALVQRAMAIFCQARHTGAHINSAHAAQLACMQMGVSLQYIFIVDVFMDWRDAVEFENWLDRSEIPLAYQNPLLIR